MNTRSWSWVLLCALVAMYAHVTSGCTDVLGKNCPSNENCPSPQICLNKTCSLGSNVETQPEPAQETSPSEPSQESPSTEPMKEPGQEPGNEVTPQEPSPSDESSQPEPQEEPAQEAGPELGPEPEPEPEVAPEPEVEPEKPPALPTWNDNPCAHQSKHKPGYASQVASWTSQDAKSLPLANGLLVIGSSSIRLWKLLQQDLTEWQVIHRGYGGSLLWDTVAHAEKIVIPYKPRAILIYAGTNDIARGTSPAEVLTGYRCLVQKVKKGLGDIPIVFIGITPNPSRWGKWNLSSQLNGEVKKLADQWPGLHYVDIAAPFLQTGQPPDTSLFVSDKLHLNAKGYKLWTSTIRPVLMKAAPPFNYQAPQTQPTAGSRALIDFGPNNTQDGNHTPSPDSQGQHWNNWLPLQGGSTTHPGDGIGLKTSTNLATPWRLVVSGDFSNNGLRNGGLQNPDKAKLGNLAVPKATQDYFFVPKAASPLSFTLTGLDPKQRYTLRMFGSRNYAQETRRTRYTVIDATGTSSQVLRTTGNNIGSDGSYDGNDNTIVTFDDRKPDAYGKLHVEIKVEEGSFAYISLLEIIVK
ncbi:MAG: hypothetical protein EP343_26290 [Deltaproteobacteria bacterium]|nr:MAG: hypothetical protein EP343_26290 [Deltaproteobacteria bacterium]